MTLLLIISIVLNAAALLSLLFLMLSKRRPGGNGELESRMKSLEASNERYERLFMDEMSKNRTELSSNLSRNNESVMNRMAEVSQHQKNLFDTFSASISKFIETSDAKMDAIRQEVENKLSAIQKENSEKLEQMRVTVDEKLHNTLEKRLGDSFKIVTDKLETVNRSLGEVQSIASNMSDLKNILANVKVRGTWGEIQLGFLLEQILAPEQYISNAVVKKDSMERVEYAIKLPGLGGRDDAPILLPIDAKFPIEDYKRLVDAYEAGDAAGVAEMRKALSRRIQDEAKKICEKYIELGVTTDFAVMFLPLEGLYAEVMRDMDVVTGIQARHRVVIAGPATLAALLNSLQVGFKTLAIQKRSGEIRHLLSTVIDEFSKFSSMLEKTRKKLNEASSSIDLAVRKSGTIQRKLKSVQRIGPDDERIEDEEDDFEEKEGDDQE